MIQLVYRRNLSEPNVVKGLVFRGVAPLSETPSTAGDIYWRWDDEPDMKWEYLGSAVAGNSLRIPFELKGRDIRLKLISRTSDGLRSVSSETEGVESVFSAPARVYSGEENIEAGEDLLAFDLVNIYNDGGTGKARKADSSDATRPCAAFVIEAATAGGSLVGGSQVRLFFGGNIIETTGRTPGAVQYLSETAGEMTETPPVGSGKVVQVIGRAISATQVIFEPDEPATLP